jgi:hypothetical protein
MKDEWKLEPIEEFIGKEELLGRKWMEFAAFEKNIWKVVSCRTTLCDRNGRSRIPDDEIGENWSD